MIKIFFFLKILYWHFKTFRIDPKNIFNTHREKYFGWKMSFYRNIFLSQYLFIAISFYCNIFLSQYLFIAISQYCEQKCLVCNGPKLAKRFGNWVKSREMWFSFKKCRIIKQLKNENLDWNVKYLLFQIKLTNNGNNL